MCISIASGGLVDIQKFTDSPNMEFEESVTLYEGGDASSTDTDSGTDTGRVRAVYCAPG